MSRDWRLYLDDITRACRKIGRYTQGMSREQFVRDERTYDAVIRNLEVIGEAANNLPTDIIAATDDVDWRKIVALRNILAHAYFGVDDDIVWSIVEDKVPRLLEVAERIEGEHR